MTRLTKLVLILFCAHCMLLSNSYALNTNSTSDSKIVGESGFNLLSNSGLDIVYNSDDEVRTISGFKSMARASIQTDGLNVLNTYKSYYGIKNVNDEIKFKSEFKNPVLGGSTGRYYQVYKGLPVIGGEFIIHKNKLSQIESIDGNYINDIDVSITPKISSNQAQKVAISYTGGKVNSINLVIYPYANTNYLSYEISVKKGFESYRIYVDANSGNIIHKYSINPRYDNLHLTGSRAQLNGNMLTGEGGAPIGITGWYDNNKYYMLNKDYNYFLSDRTNPDNLQFISLTGSTGNDSKSRYFSAFHNVKLTLDYFKNNHNFELKNYFYTGSNVLGEDKWLYVYVNEPEFYCNAMFTFDDNAIRIGYQFPDFCKDNGVLDVIAHELGHFVTHVTSDLVYYEEPGALNESFSDIIAVNTEFEYQEDDTASYPIVHPGKADRLIAEDAFLYTKAWRDFINPDSNHVYSKQPRRYMGKYRYAGDWDNGGVHVNSSVQNYFYYLLINGGTGNNEGIAYSLTGIGLQAARNMAFDVQTNRLLSTDRFYEARLAWIASAQSLYPEYVEHVRKAWDAVGVFQKPAKPTNPQWNFDGMNGVFNPQGWSNTGTNNIKWSVQNQNGNSYLSPGNLTLNQSALLKVSGYTNTGFVSFDYKMFSGLYYDGLMFYIDNQLVQIINNPGDRKNAYYYVNAGNHIFSWKLQLINTNTGAHTVYVDNINFPISNTGTMLLNGGDYYTNTGNINVGFNSILGTNYQIGGDILNAYTGIVNLTGTMNRLISLQNTEGEKHINLNLQNILTNNTLILTGKVYLDITPPTVPNIVTPQSNSQVTGNVNFAWSASTDLGIGLSGYVYQISQNSSFTSGITGIVLTNSLYKTGFAEGNYYIRVKSFDKYNQSSAWSVPVMFEVDKTAPAAPTNVSINANAINYNNQRNIVISGNGGLNETGSIVVYTLTNASQNILGSGTSNGNFVLNIDASSLNDGVIGIDLRIKDRAGNYSNSYQNSIKKDTLAPTGTIQFLSGDYSNQLKTNLNTVSSESGTFILTGNISPITGTLNQVKQVTLLSGDGVKNVYGIFVDEAGNRSTQITKSIVLDTVGPDIFVNGNQDIIEVISDRINLSGTNQDINGIYSFSINGTSHSTGTNWIKQINLVGGDNLITLVSFDKAGNQTTKTINVIRLSKTSNQTYSFNANGSVNIMFNTDFATYGGVVFSTNQDNLNNIELGTGLNTNHKLVLENLLPNTVYYVKVYGVFDNYGGLLSDLFTFKTPYLINISNDGDNKIQGTALFSGFDSTGLVFKNTKNIEITSESNSKNSIKLNTNGMRIVSSGANWDGIIMPPTPVVATGSFQGNGGYLRVAGLTFRMGSESSHLQMIGGSILVTLDVGAVYNGQTLKVFSSNDNGVNFSDLTTCLVVDGLCKFNTTHFSDFTIGVPSQSSSSSSTPSGSGSGGGGGGGGSTYLGASGIVNKQTSSNQVVSSTDLSIGFDPVLSSKRIYNVIYKVFKQKQLSDQKVQANLIFILKKIQINQNLAILKSMLQQDLKKYQTVAVQPTKPINQPTKTISKNLSNSQKPKIIVHIAPNGKIYKIEQFTNGFTIDQKKYYSSLESIMKYIDTNNPK